MVEREALVEWRCGSGAETESEGGHSPEGPERPLTQAA